MTAMPFTNLQDWNPSPRCGQQSYSVAPHSTPSVRHIRSLVRHISMIFEVKIRANSEPSQLDKDPSVDSLVLRLLL
jgi:hypothetical protein